MKGENFIINKKNGILLVCEGISGSGKSMTIDRLYNVVKKHDPHIKVIEWNSNKFIRNIVRTLDNHELLSPSIYSYLQWISFIIDYLFKIKPSLNRNYIVIADRYAHTGLTRDNSNMVNNSFGKLIYKLVRKPDLLLYHDISAQICLKRIKSRGKSLFYTNKEIISSSKLEDKDLYYLNLLEKEYKKLLSSSNKESNIYYVSNDVQKSGQLVSEYIIEKKNCKQQYFAENYKEGERVGF